MPSRILPYWQSHERTVLQLTRPFPGPVTDAFDLILPSGRYTGPQLATTINAQLAAVPAFADITVTTYPGQRLVIGTSWQTEFDGAAPYTYEFLDADFAAFLGFNVAVPTAGQNFTNPLPAEHTTADAELSPGSPTFERRFVGPAVQALQGSMGRPFWGYHDVWAVDLWLDGAELPSDIGAWRRFARSGGQFVQDTNTLTAFALTAADICGVVTGRMLRPELVLDQLVAAETDAWRSMRLEMLVEAP